MVSLGVGGGGLGWGSAVESLMRAPVVGEVDPCPDFHADMLQDSEALRLAQRLLIQHTDTHHQSLIEALSRVPTGPVVDAGARQARSAETLRKTNAPIESL